MKPKMMVLSTSKDEFIKRMIFSNQEEKESCFKYLELKGLAYHIVLSNFIGLDESGKIAYEKVRNLYIYDKRIRNILYKYLSAFEEGIRAYISNRYASKNNKIKQLSKPIYKAVQDGSSLAHELENLDFNKLILLSLKLKQNELAELYNDNSNLELNLGAVRKLRNVVSHHRMLFVYEDYGSCIVNNIKSNTLIHNLKNLRNLLNPYYQKFFIDRMKNACYDEEYSNFFETLPDKTVFHGL